MRVRLFVLVSVVVVVFLAAPLIAQQGSAGLRGRVLDPDNNGLPGVTVTVRNQQTGQYRSTVSDNDGVYFMSGLVPGVYEAPPGPSPRRARGEGPILRQSAHQSCHSEPQSRRGILC